MSNLVFTLSAIVALLSAVGGGIAWIVGRLSSQAARFDRMETRYNDLHREHTLGLVKMERFRLAFQIVAAELAIANPKSSALVHARALLSDSFIFPEDDRSAMPPDMVHALAEIDEKTL